MTEKLKMLMEDWVMDIPSIVTFSSDFLAALPAEHLKDPDPTIPAQTSGTSFNVVFDVSSLPQPWGEIGLFIGNHNLSPDVVIHFQANATNSWGSPSVNVTLDLSDFIDDTNYTGTDELFNKIFLRLINGATTTFSYDFIRITFSDSTNTDGYLRIGILSVGPVGGEQNFTYGYSHNVTTDDMAVESSTSDMYGRPGKAYPQVQFGFSYVGMDMLARLRRWIENGGYQKERWVALSPNGSEGATFTYYGRIVELTAITEVLKDNTRGLYSVEMTIDDLVPSPKKFEQSSITTHADLVKSPNRTDVFLALPMPGELITDWTLDDTDTYYADYPATDEVFQVVQIWVDGEKITRQTSLANCKANAGSWYFDIESAKRPYLHLADASDPSGHIVELRVLIVPTPCSGIPSEQKWLVMDVEVDSFTISNVVFRSNLTDSGLESISSSLESPYFGVSVPNATTIQIMNGKRRYSDVHGRYDTFADRFIWKQRYTEIYHGGYPLTFTDYLFLDRYSMISVECSDETLGMEFDSGAVLQKKIPQEVFENDSGFRLDYKPWFRGFIEALPLFPQTTTVFGLCGHFVDAVTYLQKGPKLEDQITEFTVETDAEETDIIIDPPPKKDDVDSLSANARANVDIDGNFGEPTQLAGAFLRNLLNTLGGVPLGEIPSTTFQDFDTDYGIIVREYIEGGENTQTTLRTVLDVGARSLFVIIRRVQGEWQMYRYDPNNLRASVATIYADEWINCSREVESETIIRRVRVAYAADLGIQKSKFVTADHPTAGSIYQTTEVLEVQPSILINSEDAESVRDLYLGAKGIEQMVTKGQATGEIFNAWPGDVVTVYRPKGLDADGVWDAQQFIVREIVKHCASRPGFCDVVLMNPAAALSTNDAGGGDVVFAGHNTAQEVSDGATGTVTDISKDRNHGGGGMLIWVMYNMGVTPCLPDLVEWNGTDYTANLVADSSAVDTNVRIAVYFIASAASGTHTAHVHFPNVVDCVTLNVNSLTNGASIRDSAVTYQATGKTISTGVTSAAGDVVVDGFIEQAAPPITQHSLGAGQISHCAQRMSFNGSFSSTDSSTAHGSHKDGASGTVTMKHIESMNNSRKVHIVVSVQP